MTKKEKRLRGQFFICGPGKIDFGWLVERKQVSRVVKNIAGNENLDHLMKIPLAGVNYLIWMLFDCDPIESKPWEVLM